MLVHRRWVEVPFKSIIGNTLKPEEAANEYRKLRNGDIESYEKLLFGHLRLGLSIVAHYATKYPNKVDDLVSEMLVALTNGCNRMANGSLDNHLSSPNVGGYLNQTVTGRIKKFLQKERLVPLTDPRRTSDAVEEDFSDELMEIVNKAIQDEDERRVITLRLKGFSDPQIAEQMEYSRGRIQQIRQNVVRRVKEMLDVNRSGTKRS